jgi:orotidine-5'-phosphate decarboxylase
MHFGDRVNQAVRAAGNPVVVGIDPRAEDLPRGLREGFPPGSAGLSEAFEEFGRGVVDAVGSGAGLVKFQAAFYELLGPEGVSALQSTVRYAMSRDLIVIIDGKRNDIGSTAEAYARGYLDSVPVGGGHEPPPWGVDAVTVNPYLGSDGVMPFVDVAARAGRGLFVLVRTSNPSAGEFQDLVADGRPVYRHVAGRVAGWAAPHRGASGYSCVGAVVGATYAGQLAELRAALPGVLLLVPGYGAQGASSADVAAAFDGDGLGALVNSSRGLTFAYKRPEFAGFGGDWQGAIRAALRAMADDLAANTPAGRLRGG